MPDLIEDKNTILQQRLAILREKYAERLPQKVEQIGSQLNCYLKKQDEVSLQALRQSVHKLKGSGATYGFDAVSDAAKMLEDALVALLKKEPNPPLPTTEALKSYLSELQKVAESSVSSA